MLLVSPKQRQNGRVVGQEGGSRPMLSAKTSEILAICVLALLAAALVGRIVVMIRRLPFSPIQSALYGFNYLMTRVLWRAQIRGPFPVPPGQGAVIVCNHRCPLDPSFIAITVPRAVHWMVAKEYCEHPAFRWLLRMCEIIPVSRGGVDTAATKAAIRLVQNGELVGVFPEGRINTTEQTLLPGRSGAAMIALKARAPLVPCFIHGAPYDGTTIGCLFMSASVRLEIGQPIDLSPYFDRDDTRKVLEEVTRKLLREIARLGGDPDFQPQVAGRSYKPDD
jgi:1-acyl-sn-glycerol-3-phosphate acyltransferase